MKTHSLETSTHHAVAATLADICGSTIGMRREEIKAKRSGHRESIPGNLGEVKQKTLDTPRYGQRRLAPCIAGRLWQYMYGIRLHVSDSTTQRNGGQTQGALFLSDFPASLRYKSRAAFGRVVIVNPERTPV
jgi:hypothetical protein